MGDRGARGAPAAGRAGGRARGGAGPVRAVVLGLGPAGRIAAHRAAARGWDVVALDPGGGSVPSTVGAWARQLPGWLPAGAVASRFRPAVIGADGRRRLLRDEYVILDTAVLAGLGGFPVIRARGLGGVRVDYVVDGGAPRPRGARRRLRRAMLRLQAAAAPDPGEGPSAHVLRGADGSADDGATADAPGATADAPGAADPEAAFARWTSPDVLVDAAGAGGAAALGARQIAVGHVLPGEALPRGVRVPVLMDFTVPGAGPGRGRPAAGAADDPAGGGSGDLPATFSYRLPLGDGTWLVEETILAARAGSAPDDPRRLRLRGHVRRRQEARLADLGIDPAAAVAVEDVDFALGPRHLPDNRPRARLNALLAAVPCPGRPGTTLDLGVLARPVGGRGVAGYGVFGAAGGWMHPATGYSVGAVLADVDRFLDRLAARADASPPGGRVLARLRRRGLAALLGFDDRATRAFFGVFLRLPEPFIRAYLTGGSPAATLGVMAALAVPLGLRSPRTLALLLRGVVRRLPG